MVYFSHDTLADALCSLAQRGIRVRLLTDVVMTRPAHQPITHKLAAGGVAVRVLPLPTGRRMHMKIAVIDGQTLIAGTANWTTAAMDFNIEDMLCFDSPELARLYTDYLEAIRQVSHSFAPLARNHRVTPVAVQPTTGPTGFLTGLPPTGPRTNFNNILSDPIFPAFDTRAAVAYLADDEYLPVLLDLIQNAHQSILISMFVMPQTKTDAAAQEQVIRALERAVARGVYVYLLLHTPTSVQDRLHEARIGGWRIGVEDWGHVSRGGGLGSRLQIQEFKDWGHQRVEDWGHVSRFKN
jgi:phosphatidylserine/phosphatidylglycerophosphate/cardiolipin synthase-like enzyme